MRRWQRDLMDLLTRKTTVQPGQMVLMLCTLLALLTLSLAKAAPGVALVVVMALGCVLWSLWARLHARLPLAVIRVIRLIAGTMLLWGYGLQIVAVTYGFSPRYTSRLALAGAAVPGVIVLPGMIFSVLYALYQTGQILRGVQPVDHTANLLLEALLVGWFVGTMIALALLGLATWLGITTTVGSVLVGAVVGATVSRVVYLRLCVLADATGPDVAD